MSSELLTSGTSKSYYPVLLDLSEKSCLVVGGGDVAYRKVRILLKFNARIKLVSPRVTKSLIRLAEAGRIAIITRGYLTEDLEGTALVFAATDLAEINAKIKADAGERNIPVNVVDNPQLCDFIVPSIVKKGPISIAISTSGTLPSLSKKLRKLITTQITDDYVRYAEILGRIRRLLIETEKDSKRRGMLLRKLGNMDISEVNRMGFRGIKSRFLTTHK